MFQYAEGKNQWNTVQGLDYDNWAMLFRKEEPQIILNS